MNVCLIILIITIIIVVFIMSDTSANSNNHNLSLISMIIFVIKCNVCMQKEMKVNGSTEWLYHLSPPHSRVLITHLHIPSLTMTAEGRSGGDRLEWPGGGDRMEGNGYGARAGERGG